MTATSTVQAMVDAGEATGRWLLVDRIPSPMPLYGAPEWRVHGDYATAREAYTAFRELPGWHIVGVLRVYPPSWRRTATRREQTRARGALMLRHVDPDDILVCDRCDLPFDATADDVDGRNESPLCAPCNAEHLAEGFDLARRHAADIGRV